jgi:poly(A) polymerase
VRRSPGQARTSTRDPRSLGRTVRAVRAPRAGERRSGEVTGADGSRGRRAQPDGVSRSLADRMVPDRFTPVLDELAPLAERFRAAGHRIYLVGGTVRDLLLGAGRRDHDLDLTTDARPPEIKALLQGWADAVWTQGERFGTIGAMRRSTDGSVVPDRTYEITTFRAEAYTDDSRKPQVTFADEIGADLSRRDFTVNAMALELTGAASPVLVDPFGGAADLVSRTLRTPLGAEVSFSDDPLRMLRAARFIARDGLEPTEDVVTAVRSMASRLEIVSAERIRDEFDKLMTVDHPTAGLWFLVDTGLAEHFLPELPALRLEHDPIHRHKDVLTHTFAVVENVRPAGEQREGHPPFDFRITRLAALFHDVGKPRTRGYQAGKGTTFHHHDAVGARITKARMTAMRYSNDDIAAVTELVALHLRFHTYRLGWTDAAVRRYVRDAGELLTELNVLTRCDCTTRNERKARTLSRRMDELEARIAELAAAEELASIRPDLDGRQVMEHLGIAPGPLVGEAMAFLLELRLEEGPLGEDEARRRLDAWFRDRA